ncbi:MAG: hypothetical protein WAV95_13575 [Azonexus sp.]
MPRINLNFAQTRQPPHVLAWFGLILGLTAVGATVGWQQEYWQPRLSAAEASLRTAQTALAARQPAARKIDDVQLAAEWNRASAVAGKLNMPWEKLFATFEAEAERHVGLLSLEPDVTKGELILTAEAKNFEEMLAYYRMLQTQEHLSAVILHTHQVNQQDREKPIRFRITAKWGASS